MSPGSGGLRICAACAKSVGARSTAIATRTNRFIRTYSRSVGNCRSKRLTVSDPRKTVNHASRLVSRSRLASADAVLEPDEESEGNANMPPDARDVCQPVPILGEVA